MDQDVDQVADRVDQEVLDQVKARDHPEVRADLEDRRIFRKIDLRNV